MESVQDVTITLGEAARHLQTSVDAVHRLIYEGRLPAAPDASGGRLLEKRSDLEHLRRG